MITLSISNLENLTPLQARSKQMFVEAEPIIAEDIQEFIYSISAHNFSGGFPRTLNSIKIGILFFMECFVE